MCNQNRVNCEALSTVMKACKEFNQGVLNCDVDYDKSVPENITICSKCYNPSMLIVDYLFSLAQCKEEKEESSDSMKSSSSKSKDTQSSSTSKGSSSKSSGSTSNASPTGGTSGSNSDGSTKDKGQGNSGSSAGSSGGSTVSNDDKGS